MVSGSARREGYGGVKGARGRGRPLEKQQAWLSCMLRGELVSEEGHTWLRKSTQCLLEVQLVSPGKRREELRTGKQN